MCLPTALIAIIHKEKLNYECLVFIKNCHRNAAQTESKIVLAVLAVHSVHSLVHSLVHSILVVPLSLFYDFLALGSSWSL